MKKINVLITGATGFVGSHVLEAFQNQENVSVIVACRNKSKLLPSFKGEIRQGDLTDNNYIKNLVKDIDIVCHAAAWTSLWSHRKDEEQFYRDPTIALINAAIENGVKRFIFGSSVVITGFHRNGKPVKDLEPDKHIGNIWPHMDIVADIEDHMRKQSNNGTAMIALRIGHFVGARYNKGFLSMLLPRLKTHMVPWVGGGKARVPFIDGSDIGNAYILATKAIELQGFESFNVCGEYFPTMREVINYIHSETGISKPHFGVPLKGAYAFGWLMEKLSFIIPGDPLLTRGIVYLGEDWYAPNDLSITKLGFKPKVHWKESIRKQLKDMEHRNYEHISLVDK